MDKPLRRDAERNRQLLLEAARELFAEQGLSVSLDDIARRAGVGVGTAYRRFGSRDELVEALFEQRVQEIVDLADEALECADPWSGLVCLLDRLVALQAADRGLKEVLLGSGEGRRNAQRIREQMRPRVSELVCRARESGSLRRDFDPSDLPLLHMMVGAVAEVATPERPELWRRFLGFMIDGLRAPGFNRDPLDEPPIGFETLDEVMCRWRPPRRRP